MVSLPSLPTDSLYKFVAVAGLALFGIGFILPILVKRDMSEHSWRITTESDERIRENTALLLQIIRSNPSLKGDVERNQLLIEQTELVAQAENHRKKAETEKKQKSTDRNLGYLLTCRILGFVFAAPGFVLWYFRVQRYQDMLLQADVESKISTVKRT